MAVRKGPSTRARLCQPGGLRYQAGATTVEFALVAIPFLLMLGAVLEVGLMLFSEAQLRIATAATARRLWLGQLPATANADAIRNDVCNQLTLLPNCAGTLLVNMQASANFRTLSVRLPSAVTTDATPATIAGQSVALLTVYDWTYRLVPKLSSGPRTQRLYALSVFKPE